MKPCLSKGVGGLPVKDLMSAEVIRVRPSDSAVAVGNLLAERRISGAVVMEGDKIAGVISKESFVASVKYMGANPIDSFRVEDFMARTFETADVDDPLTLVVDRMMSSPTRVDRVLVLEGKKLAGILTKSDIARVFAEHAGGCFKVRDLMQLNPSVVHDYTPLRKILDEITLSKDKRVIVMAGQRILGIITVLDLSLALFDRLKRHPGKDVLDLVKLDEVITLSPIAVGEGVDAAEAASLMVENRVGGLPVFDHKLKGVITKSDIVKGFKILKDSKKLK